jgi:gluconate 2-dehydrogenase gamma chain
MVDDAKSRDSRQHPENTMDRRDLLKVLSTVPAAAALLPAGAARAAEMTMAHGAATQTETPAKALGPYQPTALNAHEYKTVEVLSDIIVPADERSGSATQAGVPQFMDEWLGSQGGLDTIRGGITWLDLESNRAFGHDFVAASEAEKKKLLDRIAYPKTAAPEDAPGVVFFNRMRSLVLGGFYTSQMGIQDLPYLGNQMLPEWTGCPANVLAKLGVSYEK